MKDTKSQSPNRRNSKLPNPSFQIRLVLSFTGLCAIALIMQSLIVGAQFSKVLSEFPDQEIAAMGILAKVVAKSLGIALLLALPGLALIAIHRTHRIAGPIYRFEQHLREVINGEKPKECKIREHDDHQELCELINKAIAAARKEGAEEAKSASASVAMERQAA